MSGVGAVAARVGVLAFTDSHNARILTFTAIGLFAVGILLALGTRYWWRRARNEPPALGRLETMPAVRLAPSAARIVDPDAVGDDDGATELDGAAAGLDPGLRAELEVTE